MVSDGGRASSARFAGVADCRTFKPDLNAVRGCCIASCSEHSACLAAARPKKSVASKQTFLRTLQIVLNLSNLRGHVLHAGVIQKSEYPGAMFGDLGL